MFSTRSGSLQQTCFSNLALVVLIFLFGARDRMLALALCFSTSGHRTFQRVSGLIVNSVLGVQLVSCWKRRPLHRGRTFAAHAVLQSSCGTLFILRFP